MEKRKGRSLNAIYSKPLPLALSVDTYGPLPDITLHNPLSWCFFFYKFMTIYCQEPPQVLESKVKVKVSGTGSNRQFHVDDAEGMSKLWSQGFFGKGTLSRSEPTWSSRVSRRYGLWQDNGGLTNEEITVLRRDERKAFKTLRSKIQGYEQKQRAGTLSSEDQKVWDELNIELDRLKSTGFGNSAGANSIRDPLPTEGSAVVDVDAGTLKNNLETLQLQRVEAFFLRFALDAISVESENVPEVRLSQLFDICMESDLRPNNRFLLEYVVYHHFRSLGWCVRSGIKFGCDMLLYKRGPPFTHAEYAVLVIPNDNSQWTTWEDFMAVSRVVSGVKKSLVLVYVDYPDKIAFDSRLDHLETSDDFKQLFTLYKVTEVICKRWSPSRTRE